MKLPLTRVVCVGASAGGREGCKLVGIADYIVREDRGNGFVIGDNVIAMTWHAGKKKSWWERAEALLYSLLIMDDLWDDSDSITERASF